jgi:hypothetical protein
VSQRPHFNPRSSTPPPLLIAAAAAAAKASSGGGRCRVECRLVGAASPERRGEEWESEREEPTEEQQPPGALLSWMLGDEEATVTAHLRSRLTTCPVALSRRAQAAASGRFDSVGTQPIVASGGAAAAGAPAAAASEGEAGSGLIADCEDNSTANAVFFLDFRGTLLALGVLQGALSLDLEKKWRHECVRRWQA